MENELKGILIENIVKAIESTPDYDVRDFICLKMNLMVNLPKLIENEEDLAFVIQQL